MCASRFGARRADRMLVHESSPCSGPCRRVSTTGIVERAREVHSRARRAELPRPILWTRRQRGGYQAADRATAFAAAVVLMLGVLDDPHAAIAELPVRIEVR